MKKLTVLSMITAALLLSACGDSATGSEAKAATEKSTMKCAPGKCGGDKKSATDVAKDAVSNAADKVKAAASEKATEAVDSVKDAATSAVDSVKDAATSAKDVASEKATEAVDSVKDAATSAVDSVKDAATTATAAVASAVNTDAGKALYAKCSGCHGADGKTKAMGKAPMLAGQSAEDIASHIAGYKAGTRNEHGLGMLMKGQVASLSEDDVKAISAYIAGL